MIGQDEWPSESRFIPTETETEGEWPSETRFLSSYIQQKVSTIDWKWIALGIGVTFLITRSMRKK